MLLIKDRFTTPPGYWRFQQEGSPEPIRGGDYGDLLAKVADYRIINSLPLGDVEAEVNDWLCRNTGAKCVPANPAKPMPGRKARGQDVATFLRALAQWVRSDEVVSQDEAEKRAEVCAGCTWNVESIDSCLGCFGLLARIMQIIGNRKTRMDSVLKFCGRCGCSLPVVAFAPMAALDRAHSNADFKGVETGQTEGDGTPTLCWRGKS